MTPIAVLTAEQLEELLTRAAAQGAALALAEAGTQVQGKPVSPWLTFTEASELLHGKPSAKTLYSWAMNGQIPAGSLKAFGSHTRICREWVLGRQRVAA